MWLSVFQQGSSLNTAFIHLLICLTFIYHQCLGNFTQMSIHCMKQLFIVPVEIQ